MTSVYPATSPTTLHDNAYTTALTGYRRCSPFARWVFQTDASILWLQVYCNLYATFPDWSHVGIVIDGVYTETLVCTATGVNTFQVAFDPGMKTVEIVPGLQSKPSGTVIGVYPVAAYFYQYSSLSEVAPTVPADRVLIYGDSIAVGANAATPTAQGWPVLLRARVPVLVEAHGYRALHDDAVDATARQAFADHIAALSPAVIWFAIGTNDYGLNKWTAANFGTAYADLLDKLHTALPSAVIYTQTPLLRTTETANASGSTLGDYRTQIETAQSARSAYCTLVDGTDIMTTGDLADGLHPTTAGHALYAAYAETVLGL